MALLLQKGPCGNLQVGFHVVISQLRAPKVFRFINTASKSIYLRQRERKPVPLSCPNKGTTIKAPYWKQAALRKVQKIWER